jgi:hypothetical protein
VSRIVDKIHAFSHSEFDTEGYTDEERIGVLVEKGENLYGKVGEKHKITYVEIDESFPAYVRENVEQLEEYIRDV